MESVTIAIITYVSLKFLDQFLVKEGYGRIRKWLFPTKRYCDQLISIIYETIDEHEKKYPYDAQGNRFPFYHSQILFEELNNLVLFKIQFSKEDLINKLQENPNIIIPNSEELTSFYDLLVDKINNDKKLKDLFINENYKSKIFDIYESIKNIESKITHIEEKVITIDEQVSFKPSEEWFQKQCRASICDLGNRYTPELNFELEVSGIFEGLGRTDIFKKEVTKQFDLLIIKGRKVLRGKPEIKDRIEKLERDFDELHSLFESIDFLGTNKIRVDTFHELITSATKTTEEIRSFYLEEERKLQKEKNDSQFYHKYGHELRAVREFEYDLSSFIRFLSSITFALANNPILILDGEAGIGKSHMIGDIVSKRISNNYESVFLLGQHFMTDEDPWTQIFKRLQINSKSDNFLNKLNERGKNSGKRIVLFIDAINEGRGKYFWNSYIRSFINEIKRYEWIGLVLTVRSSYKNLIFPQEGGNNLEIDELTLYGFRNVEYEASKLFFNNYKIELPNVPLLHPEFQNPLFLKLFCEGISKSGLNRVPSGVQGISSIINFFIKSVNNVLSKPNRVGYSNSINLVKKSIDAIIQYKVEKQLKYMPYEMAFQVIDVTVSNFIDKKGFLEELIAEGVLSKNLFWKSALEYEEGVYLAYERFEDHLTSQYLLEKYPNLDVEFKEGGKLYHYVKDVNSIHINKGLIDAFSIQIPEISGKEFFDFIPHLKDKYPIAESFVESLLWRKVETINEKSKDYVNKYVFSYQDTYDLFWETILAVTALPNHYFNASSLHNHLMKFSLPDRDAGWTQLLKYKYDDNSSVKRLIDWAWNENDKTHISDESIKLSSIALAWFHTSTNRRLRDCSTKALVCLLQDRLNVLIEVLMLFENVNDPYVYERLFAAAYGCALRTKQIKDLAKLSEYINDAIFKDKDEIYPHALLRDYARGVIEFAHFSGCSLSFNVDLVRPPYKSIMPDKIMTNDEIDAKYEFDYNAKDFKDHYWSQNNIIDSMTTEYGRGTGRYGDFGRYTFERALKSWDVNANDLSNLALEWIFEKYGYDVEKHGKFDRKIGSGRGRDTYPHERIGKKYQWIALYEMVARLSDNFKKYEEWSFRKEKEEPYQGPWNPYIRDIDPTMLINKTGSYDDDETQEYWWSEKNNFNWDCSNEDWIKDSINLPDFKTLIRVKDHGNEEWLILEGYPEWAEPKKIGEEKWNYPHKRLWCQIRSYLVVNSDFQKLIEWSMAQDFMGRWMPENHDRYEIFSREYFWSSAHKYFATSFYEGEKWRDINDKESQQLIAKVIVSTENFLWEEEFDKSKEDTISFLKPCISIYEGMKLKYSRKEGEFLNSSDEVVCFAANVYHNSKSYLLIKKIPFLNYLEENDLNIIWTVLGEKQIIGGRMFSSIDPEYDGRLEISGSFFFKNDCIEEKINTEYIK
jgi:hypothetical protein